MYNPIIYYLAGFASAFLMLFALGMKKQEKEKSNKKKSWTKIENISFNFDVDYDMRNKMTGQEVAIAVSEIMKNRVSGEGSGLEDVKVEPGNYSINMNVAARFVKRD